MSLYQQLTEQIKTGKSYKIDLYEKTLKINNIPVIKNGEFQDRGFQRFQLDTDNGIFPETYEEVETLVETLECLYKEYKYSYPSKSSKSSKYFKAAKLDELTDEQLATGLDRNIAKFNLECFVLLLGIKDEEFFEKLVEYTNPDKENRMFWFWQSTNDKDFIILKNYIDRR